LLPLPARPPTPSMVSVRHDPDAGDSLATYWSFYWAVAAAQLTRWLPRRPARILDLSGPRAWCAEEAAAAGHTVIEVLDPAHGPVNGTVPGHVPLGGSGRFEATASLVARPLVPESLTRAARANGAPMPSRRAGRNARLPARDREVNGFGRGPAAQDHAPGAWRRVIAETRTLGFLGDGCVDAVIAENRMLSRHLVTESTVAEMARVLRPGGRLLLSVDSLMLGMAILAEQNYWAHLSDVPSAEVVLVPWPDGTITRCFWADQLRELLTEAGFEVEWIRPRTVLSASTVEHMLAGDPKALSRLVETELAAPMNDESVGIHLVASARRLSR
jgi:SAM-dependent methyltransferase